MTVWSHITVPAKDSLLTNQVVFVFHKFYQVMVEFLTLEGSRVYGRQQLETGPTTVRYI